MLKKRASAFLNVASGFHDEKYTGSITPISKEGDDREQETLATDSPLPYFLFLMVSDFISKMSNYFYHHIIHFIDQHAKINIRKYSSKKVFRLP